mgnify:CR=1 FL=1
MTERKPLDSEPFSFRQTKSGLVQLFYGTGLVTTLAGKQAQQFLARAEGLDSPAMQQLMARATGHFKHGNER